MGTTASQKKLFFNLRKIKGQLKAFDDGDLKPDQVKQIATRLGVPEEDVVSMNRRLAGDSSLNAPVRNDSESGEWMDWLPDESVDQETALGNSQEFERRRALLGDAIKDAQRAGEAHLYGAPPRGEPADAGGAVERVRRQPGAHPGKSRCGPSRRCRRPFRRPLPPRRRPP